MSEQELLDFIESYFVTTVLPDNTLMHHIDDAEWKSVRVRVEAKLKAMGYVKWDREKVAQELKALMVKDRKTKIPWLENTDWDKLDEKTQEGWLSVADQLKEILTEEEKELHYKIPDTEEERTEGAVEKLLELEALAKMYRILHLSENYPVDLIIDWEDISEDDKAHHKKQAAQLKEKLTE